MTRPEKLTFLALGLLLALGVVLNLTKFQARVASNRALEAEIRKIGEITPKNALSKGEEVLDDEPDDGSKINVNTATVAELDALPGVGKTMAERIVDFVKANGPLKKFSELQKVEGLSGKKLDNLKRSLAVRPVGAAPASPRKLNLNFATEKELDALPGVGKGIAKAIIKLRNDKGGFRSLEDLQDVTGLTEAKFDKFKDLVEVR